MRGSCDTWRSSGALLIGRIHDDRGNLMTPAHANKYPGGKIGASGCVRYRYYVSCAIPQGRRHECGSVPRVAAHEIEELVLAALRRYAGQRRTALDSDDISRDDLDIDRCQAGLEDEDLGNEELIANHLDRVIIQPDKLVLQMKLEADGAEPSAPIIVPWSRPVHTRKREIILPHDSNQLDVRPIRAEARARLKTALPRARSWLAELTADHEAKTASIAAREKVSERSVRMTLPLAFISPTIVRAAIDGTLPFRAGVMALAELPMDWEQQGRAISLAGKTDPRRSVI